MDCPASELPGILSSFLTQIDEWKQQSEGNEEILSELRAAYDDVSLYKWILDYVRPCSCASTPKSRNRIRMTMKHIYKLVAVGLQNCENHD